MMSQGMRLGQAPAEVNGFFPTHALLLCAATVGLGASFFLAEHSLRPEAPTSPSEAFETVQTVSRSRQVGIVSVGFLGCLLLVARGGRPLVFDTTLSKLILALGALCLVSVLWTDDVAFTVRRLCSALLCFTGVLGVCRQFRPRDLCRMVLIISFAYLCVGICVELLGPGYRIPGARYRFGGTVNPNLQGMYCALLSLSAACLYSKATSRLWTLRGMFVLGVAFLLLTGSRTALYSFLVAIASYWWLTSSWHTRALALTGLPTLVASLILLGHLAGTDSNRFLSVITMGRDLETMSTMTKRIPVWSELLGYIGMRPLLGYGYQGFWHGDRVLEMGAATGWAATGAHCAYLETILSVGLIGGALHILAILIGICRARRCFLQTVDVGYGFIFALLVFGTVHSLAESAFAKPLFPGMIFVCGLSMLAFQRDPTKDQRSAQAEEIRMGLSDRTAGTSDVRGFEQFNS